MTKETAVLDVAVQFGNVSFGDATARIALRIDRDKLNDDAAQQAFCGRRLKCRLLRGDSDTDQSFIGDLAVDGAIEATCDSPRVSFTPKHVAAGLTCALAEIDVGCLAGLAKRPGRLLIETAEDLPDDAKPAVMAVKPASGQRVLPLDMPWQAVLTRELALAPAITKIGR